MVHVVHDPGDRGAVFRPPTLRVHRRAYRSGSGDTPQFLAERPDDRIVPQTMEWASNGRISTLAVRYVLGADPATGAGRVRPEHADARLDIGDSLRLVERIDGRRVEWFCGLLTQVHPIIQSNPDLESYEAIASGPEIRLAAKVVSGQWVKTVARDDAEMAGTAAAADARRAAVAASYFPAVFNEAGLPNATGESFRLGALFDHAAIGPANNGCKVFEVPGRTGSAEGSQVAAEHWTAYAALRSLIEWVDDYDVISPWTDWAAIGEALDGVVLPEVSVDGLTLLEALRTILLPVGFGFALTPWAEREPWPNAYTRPSATDKHRLIVFPLRRGDGDERDGPLRLNLASVDGGAVTIVSPAGQAANVQRIEQVRDARGVANDVTVVGDVLRRQVSLSFTHESSQRDLHPLWDTSVHSLADWATSGHVEPMPLATTGDHTIETFDRRYNARGADHHLYMHVYRTFVWNEDGAFAALDMPAPDLAAMGLADEAGNWLRRRRPVGPTFVYDDAGGKGRTYAARVQMGVDGPDLERTWMDVPAAVLGDRAGFRIVQPVLMGCGAAETWRPYARAKGRTIGGELIADAYGRYSFLTLLYNAVHEAGSPKIVFRLVGSVESDAHVLARAGRRADHSGWPLAARTLVRAPERFQRRDVYADPWGLGEDRRDLRDDTAAAAGYAAAIRESAEHCMGHGSVVLRGLHRQIAPGRTVEATGPRRFDFDTDGRGTAGGHGPIVVAVTYDFREGAGKTELALDTAALELPR